MDNREKKEIICNGYILILVKSDRKGTNEKDEPCFMNNRGFVLQSVIKALMRGSEPISKKSFCLHKHIFGVDCNKFDECTLCSKYKKCNKKQNAL
jgi:hypothetical protein